MEINKTQKITACAFIHKDGKLLAPRRANTKKIFPGKYELPGGHVEFGETMIEGLKREIREEFNLEINIGEPFYVFTYTSKNDTEHTIEVDYLATLVNPDQEIKLRPEDHSEFHWISEDEVVSFYTDDDEERKAVIRGFEILNKK